MLLQTRCYDEKKLACSLLMLYIFQIDTFSIEAVDLGPIEKVTIGHDGSGAGSAWKLEKVMVTDTLTGQEGIFPLSE